LGGGTYLLCVICGHTGVTATVAPSEGVIGAGPFSSSQGSGSISGNGAHNPFLESGATFYFETTSTLSTTSTTSAFSNVNFSFGTTYGNDAPGTPKGSSNVPEPVTMILTGGGLIALSLVKRFRR